MCCGLGAGPADLVVPAAMEMPVGLELGASNTVTELLVNVVPCRPAMPLHVVVRNLIGDALVAQTGHEPIKHDGGVAVPDRGPDLLGPQLCPDLIEQGWRPSETTNGMDQPDCVVDGGAWPVLNFGIFRVVSLATAPNCGRRYHGAKSSRRACVAHRYRRRCTVV